MTLNNVIALNLHYFTEFDSFAGVLVIITRNSSGDEITNVNFIYDEARPP